MLPFTTFTRRCSWENHRTKWELFHERCLTTGGRESWMVGWFCLDLNPTFKQVHDIWNISGFIELLGYIEVSHALSWMLWTSEWANSLKSSLPGRNGDICTMEGKFQRALLHDERGCAALNCAPWSLTWGHYLHAVPKDQGGISSPVAYIFWWLQRFMQPLVTR